MAITPVQSNTENKPKTTYRDAVKAIKTGNLTHPLPAEGHLVHDSLLSVPKFWIKDIAYDIKAVKDGFRGNANDHQIGRLNDVGIKLGGIGIATYLATRTTDPKARLMEYVGLGAFLASMSLYPKFAINAPSRIIQGFDIGKEYIDDQGRKKSVYQDGNYIPFDMYRGEYVGEDLDILGDRMGIPRNIKNRNELIKEQARKIAIQNNTLWMLSAGFAIPVMTALICSGVEKVLSPIMEFARNKLYNSRISSILQDTIRMSSKISDIQSNSLSKKIESLLNKYKGKELPNDEYNKLLSLLSENTDDVLTQGIKEDIDKLLIKDNFTLSSNFFEDITKIIEETTTGRNDDINKLVFSPTKSEIEQAIKNTGSDGKYLSTEQLLSFKNELRQLFKAKIETQASSKDVLYMEQENIIENITKNIQKNKSKLVSDENIKDITNLAKVLGELKKKIIALDKCKSFKVEHAPETVLARSYNKFENAIFDILDIKFKELRQMKDSEQFTKEIIEKKIEALVKDENKYNKAVKRLSKVLSETEIMLHGDSAKESYIKDLISAYENIYNITAKRVNNIGNGKFSSIVNKLIKDDIDSNLQNTIKDRQEMFNIIDGFMRPVIISNDINKSEDERLLEFARTNRKNVGSSKKLKISRIIERIQGVSNTQRRLIHLLDIYKREIPQDEYGKHLNEIVKSIILGASTTEHTLKLETDNNPKYYVDIIMNGWGSSIEKTTEDAMKTAGNIEKGDVLVRFKKYIGRFKDVIGNCSTDYTKKDHKIVERLKEDFRSRYGIDTTSRMQEYNLIAQNPVDFFKKASKRRFENQKWLRMASVIGASVLSATILCQYTFGKIKNPHNIKKQVNYDKNN